jgi:CP family cyanate transporter-like MFS transporter
LLAALLLYQLGPSAVQAETPTAGERLWWPDWKGALTWLLGLTFGCNNSIYFAANAFLPDYLNYQGRPDLIGSALGWLNGAQILASFVLLAMAERLQRRAWPFLIFGTTSIIALLAMATTEGAWIVAAAGLFGFAIAVTFVVLLALPALLSRPQDVHRTAAGMFTISYCFSVTVPIASGAFWDLTGLPWTAFVPLVTAAGALTVLGAFLSRHKHG